jgi:hypothetical protein
MKTENIVEGEFRKKGHPVSDGLLLCKIYNTCYRLCRTAS